MNVPAFIFLLQVFATFAMTGLIWFVQVVHYPLFAMVPDPHQADYARWHQTRTGWVVAPLMVVDLVTSLLLLWTAMRPSVVTLREAALGNALVAIVWISTTLLQVPLHRGLLQGMQEPSVRKLVMTNWIRTLAWSLRSALLLTWLTRAF